MVMKSILPRYSASSFTRSGNSSRHGSHHVAQKFTRSGLPDGVRALRSPSLSICFTDRNFAVAAGGAGTGFPAACAAIPTDRHKIAKEPLTAAFARLKLIEVPRLFLDAFDRATECIGAILLDRLSGECRVESRTEIRLGDRLGALIVVDRSVIEQD